MSEEMFIRDYFNGQLTDGEQVQFEARYKEDAAFRTKADEMEVEMLAIREVARKELKERFDNWTEDAPVRTLTGFWKIGMAATIVLIAGIAYWFLPVNRTGEELFDAYYEPYENFEVTISRDESNDDTPLMQAYKAYDAKSYGEAISLFEKVPTSHRKYEAVLFFKGISLIESGKLEKAFEILQVVVDRQDPDYQHPAIWYQALIQIKQSRTNEAEQLLSDLAKLAGEYQQKAQAVLDELD